MKIRIRTKLVTSFIIVILLMLALALYLTGISQKSLRQSVGKNSIFLAEEMLKRINHSIYAKIEELEIHSKEEWIQDMLVESNREFAKITNLSELIEQRDREWISAPKNKNTVLMEALSNNRVAKILRRQVIQFHERKYGYRVFREVFLTNKYGVNVAQAQRTTDYRQNDELWWQIAKDHGFYVSNFEFDESSQSYGITIGIGIYDPKGDFLGVLKAVLSVKDVIRNAEVTTKKYETTSIVLMTKEGLLIYRTSAFRFFEDLSNTNMFKMIGNENGFFTATEHGQEKLYSYAHSKGYKDFKGLGWILVVGHDVTEILAPAFTLRNTMLAASIILTAIGIIIAISMSRSITKPLEKLSESAETIGKGDLEHRVDVQTKDELGDLADAFNMMTERRQRAENALRESEERFRLLVESTTDYAIFMLDTKGHVFSWNTGAERIMGYKQDEIVGRHFDCFLPKEMVDQDRPEHQLETASRDGRFEDEIPLLRKDGTRFWASVIITALKDEWGNLRGFSKVTRDITERRQLYDALQQSEERYRSLFESSKDPVYITTRNGAIIAVNDAFVDFFGYTRDDLVDLKLRDTYVNPEERSKFQKEIEKYRYVKDYIVRLRKKNAEQVDCLLTATVRTDSHGTILGYQGILRDVTMEKRTAEEIRESREQLRNLSRYLQTSREQERASVAREIHDDLGQILTALKMDLSWLGKRLPKDNMALTKKQSEIDQTLDLAIDSVQRIMTSLRPGLLDDLGLEAAIEWQITDFQDRTGVVCRYHQNPEGIHINEELSTALFRIIQETLTNVARHANATQVDISLEANTDELVLKVKDNGKGITEAQISHSKSFGLLGIKERAHVLGGKVKIEGTRNQGTSVTVRMPLG